MPINTRTGDTEAEKRLIAAMLKVDEAIHFYHSVHGNVSTADIKTMATEAQRAVISVADLLWVDE
jgi:hypothetical protein